MVSANRRIFRKKEKRRPTSFQAKKCEAPDVVRLARGCGSPVVKVSDHGMHVMISSPVPLKTHRVGKICTLNLSRAETSSRWQIKLEVNSDVDQELLDSHNDDQTHRNHELMEMREEKQDIEEFESLDPVQSEDRMTVGKLTEG
ncbi:hypothetical protein TNCV_2249611 [Trichonephila clavipes]|nr:hypothetical protein TNCV_2249611 [Trichonephila clavipes]